MKPVGEPDAGNPHVRFDERGRETERLPKAQATAPFLDSTPTNFVTRGRRRILRTRYHPFPQIVAMPVFMHLSPVSGSIQV